MQKNKLSQTVKLIMRSGFGLSLSLSAAICFAEEESTSQSTETAAPEALQTTTQNASETPAANQPTSQATTQAITEIPTQKSAETITQKTTNKILVTGSSIKGVAAQSASPISIVKTQDLAKQGVTTVEEALSTISANQSTFVAAMNVGTSGTAGSVVDLRGLGSNKTLVLFNGRRLANSPFDSATVDLNSIPLALIERIEVLKDGASAVYGTDAIGGVINFITKKDFQGGGVSIEASKPQAGGGATQQYGVFAGYGDLEEQGFNIFAALNFHEQAGVMASQRSFSQRGGIIPELGMNFTSGGSFPANIVGIGNPYAASGCGDSSVNRAELGYCRFNSQKTIGIVPESNTLSFLGKGSYKINDHLDAFAEYVHSENTIRAKVANDVMLGGGEDYFIGANSPYYPGNGITPDLDGVIGQDLSLNLRSQAGNRVSERVVTSDRFLVGIDGSMGQWDINSAVQYSISEAQDNLVSGYINNQKVRDRLANGELNPFGPSANASIWQGFNVSGLSQDAKFTTLNFDVTLSRPIYTLPAGDVGFAVGATYRKDDWYSGQNAAINSVAESTGVDPTGADSQAKRDIQALFSEFQIPITEKLNAQLAARYDQYSDFGGSFNPKVALRWQPIKSLMFRSSYSTGFRAPSLYELTSSKILTNTSTWNDPLLCPGGVVSAGGNQIRDCNIQFLRQNGGNSELQAETSKSFNFGVVYEPIKNLVLSADYFNIAVDDQIGIIPESAIFNQSTKYADLYFRNPDQSLAYVNQELMNLGKTQTSGLDLTVQWRSPETVYGRFAVGVDATYLDSYKFQTEKNGEWFNALGRYDEQFGAAVSRWKHNANLNWAFEQWHLNLQQSFLKGYRDQNADGQNHRVSNYTLYNLSGSYTGFKNVELTVGIKNLFDTNPPATNVSTNFQYGYDPRYSDPLGRIFFGRATYKF